MSENNKVTTAGAIRASIFDAMKLLRDGKITAAEAKAAIAPAKAYNKAMRDKIKAMKTAIALEKQQAKK